MDARIEAWIESVGADLDALTAAEFDDFRAAVVAEKLERDKTLSEECSRHWRRIADGSLDFQRGMTAWYLLLEMLIIILFVGSMTFVSLLSSFLSVANEVAALRALTKTDIVDFYTAFIRVGGRSRAKLSAQVFGHGHAVVGPLSAPAALRAAPLVAVAADASVAVGADASGSSTDAAHASEEKGASAGGADIESPEALRASTAAAAERACQSAITVHVSNELDFRRSMPLLPSAL